MTIVFQISNYIFLNVRIMLKDSNLLNLWTCKKENVWVLGPTFPLISCLWPLAKYSTENHTGSLPEQSAFRALVNHRGAGE